MNDTNRSSSGFKAATAGIVLAFIALFVVNTFIHSPPSRERAADYFSAEEIDRGLEFSFERKLLSWCGVGLQLALLTSLVCTTWGRRSTDFFDRCTGHRWVLTLICVGATYMILSELLSLPVGLMRLEHSRAWDLTSQSTAAWFIDWIKELALSAVQGLVLTLGLYGLMWLLPRWWWLFAALGATLFGVLYIFMLPEVIQPMFNKFTPLDDPFLRERVRALAKRANVPVDEVLVMDASSRSRHTNAYFVGFGSTRRIVLYDTLLRSHSGIDAASTGSLVALLGSSGCGPLVGESEILAARSLGYDEIETVLAHEIGHWRHQHIVKGIILAGLCSLVGMYLLARILKWAVGRKPFCLTSPTDPAGLPLILLLFMLASWLTLPVQNGISRYFERQADADSLALAEKPEAFIEAEKRLARDNLSNVAPVPFNVWMFSSHPPAVERIEMAERWANAARQK
jgi:STE24 endopeptidase